MVRWELKTLLESFKFNIAIKYNLQCSDETKRENFSCVLFYIKVFMCEMKHSFRNGEINLKKMLFVFHFKNSQSSNQKNSSFGHKDIIKDHKNFFSVSFVRTKVEKKTQIVNL